MPHDIVATALAEDLGAAGDVTTRATVPPDARGLATITQKAPGVLFGLDLVEETMRQVDAGTSVQRLAEEGAWLPAGTVVCRITGRAGSILTAERVALNFLQRLSGVATLTAQFVRAVQGTGAQILDTRKTTPGLRALEKAAVRAGGGTNHRFGLFDMVLIKENHAALAGGVGAAVRAALAVAPDLPIEVECRTRAEVDEALKAGATRLLLDNMTPAELAAIARDVGDRATLEASGGVTLETVGEVAQAGVHWVSVGALTHSAPALDLSLILEPQT